MSECPECDIMRRKRTEEELYSCVLCGEKRCFDHTVWVPAHVLDSRDEQIVKVAGYIRDEPYSGWYSFCGQGAHVPRGVPIRHGKDRQGGKLIELVPDAYKKAGLEFFRMWEVGLVENSFEKRWNEEFYTLSCSLAAVLEEVALQVQSGGMAERIREQVYEKAVVQIASGKLSFATPTRDEFYSQMKSASTTKDFVGYICSRCKIVPCINRQREFHDSKIFRKLIKEPALESGK
ncbi:MAG: hypothetical protein ACFFEF_16550 [Candidatus Thorarchaeota archaeon]